MNDKYVLDENMIPVPEEDIMKWARFMQDQEKRRVAREQVGNSLISTIFLGLDHAWGSETPVLWETLVVEGYMEGEMDRCSGTLEDAKLMHARMVLRVKSE